MVRGVLNAVPDPTFLCRRRQGEIDMHGIMLYLRNSFKQITIVKRKNI
jgi:hypothetical protein